MKAALQMNLAMSLLLMAFFAYLFAGYRSDTRAVFLAVSVAYVLISLLAIRRNRWAVLVAVLVACFLTARWLPVVGVNLWMLITGHELYRDSPATIFIVLINAAVFMFPSTVVCVLYYLNRKELWQLLRYGNAGAKADESKSESF